MSNKVKSNLLKYGITGTACAGVAAYHVFSQNIGVLPLMEVYRVLCDAFFLPGILLVFSGLLIWLSNQGAMDALGYMLKSVVRFLIPGPGPKHEKYGDYVQRRREKNVTGYGFVLIVGLISLAIAIVFNVLYSNLHGPI